MNTRNSTVETVWYHAIWHTKKEYKNSIRQTINFNINVKEKRQPKDLLSAGIYNR
jgi:hypothetical protein